MDTKQTETVTFMDWCGPDWAITPVSVIALDLPVSMPAIMVQHPSRALEDVVFGEGTELSGSKVDDRAIQRELEVRWITSGLPTDVGSRLVKLALLEEDWDGFGGHPSNIGAITGAVQMIKRVSELSSGTVSSPFVAPLADGGIELEWDLDEDRELMIVLPPSGAPRYVYSRPATPDEAGELDPLGSLQDLISRFLKDS